MKIVHVIAGGVLGFEMPVPVYWLILHGRVEFWRRHVRAGYWVAVLVAWGCGDWLLYYFRGELFAGRAPGPIAAAAGLALIAVEMLMLTSVELQLGGSRLVGHAELTRKGELATEGLYTRVRHPRYLGMIAAVLGSCLLAATKWLWIAAAVWLAIALGTVQLEERELRVRFGTAYEEYARRVPALLPWGGGLPPQR